MKKLRICVLSLGIMSSFFSVRATSCSWADVKQAALSMQMPTLPVVHIPQCIQNTFKQLPTHKSIFKRIPRTLELPVVHVPKWMHAMHEKILGDSSLKWNIPRPPQLPVMRIPRWMHAIHAKVSGINHRRVAKRAAAVVVGSALIIGGASFAMRMVQQLKESKREERPQSAANGAGDGAEQGSNLQGNEDHDTGSTCSSEDQEDLFEQSITPKRREPAFVAGFRVVKTGVALPIVRRPVRIGWDGNWSLFQSSYEAKPPSDPEHGLGSSGRKSDVSITSSQLPSPLPMPSPVVQAVNEERKKEGRETEGAVNNHMERRVGGFDFCASPKALDKLDEAIEELPTPERLSGLDVQITGESILRKVGEAMKGSIAESPTRSSGAVQGGQSPSGKGLTFSPPSSAERELFGSPPVSREGELGWVQIRGNWFGCFKSGERKGMPKDIDSIEGMPKNIDSIEGLSEGIKNCYKKVVNGAYGSTFGQEQAKKLVQDLRGDVSIDEINRRCYFNAEQVANGTPVAHRSTARQLHFNS